MHDFGVYLANAEGAALDEKGTGEAALDHDEEGLLDSVVVRKPGGKVAIAAWDGESVVVRVGE